MKQLKLIILIPFLFILSSCQEDLTPSWLAIDEFTFTTNETIEGANSHDIVDAWVYINNQEAGVWEIPFRMPVLGEGSHQILIVPGIKLNGITSTRAANTFYEPYSTTVNLTKKETTTIKPSFKYKTVCNFVAKEDFEDTGIIMNPNLEEDSTKFQIISKTDYPEIVKYGNNCGLLKLSSADTIAKILTNLNLDIYQKKMYLELDYLCTNSFAIGIINETSAGVQADQGLFAGVNRTKAEKYKWKRLYFPLSTQINLNPFADYFEFYFSSVLDQDQTEGHIYIDNIKIVYI
ncbi:MAG: hypothetical protein AB8B74_07800 [Crocinitomicaceae bacterium]